MPAHWPVASFELSAELVKRLDSLDKSVLVSLIDSEKHASAEEIHNALEVSPDPAGVTVPQTQGQLHYIRPPLKSYSSISRNLTRPCGASGG